MGTGGTDTGGAPTGDLDVIRERFRHFATDVTRAAPLYARLSGALGEDRELVAPLLAAPPEQRLPVLLFAAVHWLLLRGDPAQPLRRFYPNLAGDDLDSGDPLAAFRAFCREHAGEIAELVATRSTQTNEVARCAVLLPALALVAGEVGPLALVDVGTSAGLNLLLDRYAYRYEPGGAVGGPSTVEITCATRGPLPVPAALPVVADRVGLDRSPVDVTDDDATAWLEACVWPDQPDRFHRLQAAIELARADPPRIVRGDAVADLGATVAGSVAGHPVVTNSWMLNYLSTGDRRRYLAALEAIGAERDLSWVYAEAPNEIEGLPRPPGGEGDKLTVLTLVTWRDGRRVVRHLARSHPHGAWISWH